MTEKKWTPGPWSFDGTGPHNVFGCEINSSDGDCIAGSWHGKDNTARANAHLIAAAPDLYEALERALSWMKFHQDNPDTINHNAFLFSIRAKKVLAKARGEA